MEPATLGEDFLQPFKSHAVLEIGNVEMVMRCKGFVRLIRLQVEYPL